MYFCRETYLSTSLYSLNVPSGWEETAGGARHRGWTGHGGLDVAGTTSPQAFLTSQDKQVESKDGDVSGPGRVVTSVVEEVPKDTVDV